MSVAGRETLGEADYARFRDLILRSSGIELSEVRRSDSSSAPLPARWSERRCPGRPSSTPT